MFRLPAECGLDWSCSCRHTAAGEMEISLPGSGRGDASANSPSWLLFHIQIQPRNIQIAVTRHQTQMEYFAGHILPRFTNKYTRITESQGRRIKVNCALISSVEILWPNSKTLDLQILQQMLMLIYQKLLMVASGGHPPPHKTIIHTKFWKSIMHCTLH